MTVLAFAPKSTSRLSLYLLPDGDVEFRKADRPAPKDAIPLYAALSPYHANLARGLFALNPQTRQRRIIEAARGPISAARVQMLGAVYRARLNTLVEHGPDAVSRPD